jgi:hypothetical protein
VETGAEAALFPWKGIYNRNCLCSVDSCTNQEPSHQYPLQTSLQYFCWRVPVKIVYVVVFSNCSFNFQLALKQTADNHIFKFLKNKIVRDHRDFETQLYLCNEAFKGSCNDFSICNIYMRVCIGLIMLAAYFCHSR